jgi:hypothetical protein
MDKYTENNIEETYKLPETLTNSISGRVDLSPSENGTPLFILDKIKNKEKTNYANATQSVMEKTLLSTAFFSYENIDIIQNALRSRIYELTEQKHIIDNQDGDQLKIIMRSIFLQNSLNRNDNISRQLTDLNKLVIDYVVPQVHGELISYLKYKKDISSPPEPMKLPIHLTNDKTIELKHFF